MIYIDIFILRKYKYMYVNHLHRQLFFKTQNKSQYKTFPYSLQNSETYSMQYITQSLLAQKFNQEAVGFVIFSLAKDMNMKFEKDIMM